MEALRGRRLRAPAWKSVLPMLVPMLCNKTRVGGVGVARCCVTMQSGIVREVDRGGWLPNILQARLTQQPLYGVCRRNSDCPEQNGRAITTIGTSWKWHPSLTLLDGVTATDSKTMPWSRCNHPSVLLERSQSSTSDVVPGRTTVTATQLALLAKCAQLKAA